jgi:lipopolysaccharide/colanic/teichoic acid biosynthesis glycosyltransferase
MIGDWSHGLKAISGNSEREWEMATGYTRANTAGAGVRRPATEVNATSPAVSGEEAFHALLTIERRRAERSRHAFVLMLLDAHRENGTARAILLEALPVLIASIRETDAPGWYKDGAILGAIFTEIGDGISSAIVETLRSKIQKGLQEHLGPETAAKIVISLHVFPQHWDRNDTGWAADSKLYPELQKQVPRKVVSRAIKRTMDIVSSAMLLALLFPVLVTIAAAIKLTSKGPVLFRQERMGRFGVRFSFLKFRSMYLNNTPTIHQEYVRQFIAGKEALNRPDSKAPAVYKITNDPRVTPVGRFLRKTSLDELPQLWNVLIGEMSLVGPRPPVPYEYEIYDHWHRRRVLEMQPGITGLWQISGRSRTTFDEMVRLDLRYCRTWSLWLDLKILMATPKAVLSASGAY